MDTYRVAIYARVSTTDQTCELQLKELREYCKRRGWPIPGEYVDTGWSGAKTSRPELNRLMNEARKRKVDCIIVWKLDRWGRSMINSLETIEELHGLGVRWIAVTQNLDTDHSNPAARAMLRMMAIFAEFERELIQERVRAGSKSYREDYAAGRVGKTRHSKSGKDLPTGRPRRIFRRALAKKLREQGLSWRAIASKLGVPKSTVLDALGGVRKVVG